jgi:hypothetical protein
MPDLSELEQMAREVVSVYEGVTITGDWPQLSIPIVALRAALWRIDGVIPPDEARDAIRAVEAQCDPHWREVARWSIEEYERQLRGLSDV